MRESAPGRGLIMKEIFEYPLKQHIGASSLPLVAAGDHVARGERIASEPEGMMGSHIHSSVDGTVCDVTKESIQILADAEQSGNYQPISGDTPLERIREAGIVGLGGAGFPTYVKFQRPFERGGTVIVNAAECEPILSHNIARIEQRPDQLLRGLFIAMEISHAEHGIIAIKKCHKKAIETLLGINQNPKIRLAYLEDLYPMGEERAVIREVLGKLLPVTGLPSEADAVVINAETACRIQEAVDEKKPLIDKDLTVGGKIAGNCEGTLVQVFLDVPIGRKVSKVFTLAGGLADSYGELIMGGPFTGKRTDLSAPVIKTTGGLIAAECFPKAPEKLGLLVCACGASRERMEEIADSMGSGVAGVEYCKQARTVKGSMKCENPGKCPGQVQKVFALKKAGAQALLIGNCTDCTNTVMSCAPRLGLPVYHSTDGALRAVNHRLIRKMSREY